MFSQQYRSANSQHESDDYFDNQTIFTHAREDRGLEANAEGLFSPEVGVLVVAFWSDLDCGPCGLARAPAFAARPHGQLSLHRGGLAMSCCPQTRTGEAAVALMSMASHATHASPGEATDEATTLATKAPETSND